jgi:hypothetical protein
LFVPVCGASIARCWVMASTRTGPVPGAAEPCSWSVLCASRTAVTGGCGLSERLARESR